MNGSSIPVKKFFMNDGRLEPVSIFKAGVLVLSPIPKGAGKLLLLLHSFSVARKTKVQDVGQDPHCLGDYVCSTLNVTAEWKVRAAKKRAESGQEGEGQVEAKEEGRGERERKIQTSAQTPKIINTEKNSQIKIGS